MTNPHREPFDFAPGFDNCIAHVANNWATLEYNINASVWALAKVEPALGACMTAQIYALAGRLNALLALMKLREVSPDLIKRVNKFADDSRGPAELRNRIIHDVWLKDANEPKTKQGRIEITAPKKLSFEIVELTLGDLKADLIKIESARLESHQIRLAILDALPTLPEIPPTKLRPITETL